MNRVRHTGNSSRDDNDIGILERSLGSVVLGEVSGDFLYSRQRCSPDTRTGTHGRRRDVGQVSGHTWGVDHIVQRQLRDERRGLEEEGQRLEASSAEWEVFGGAAHLSNSSRGTGDDCWVVSSLYIPVYPMPLCS
jgi:hypothetical protein